ncbi:MAG TPA: L-rhamnose isomerase [Candidatus Binatia bacterium]|jgi:L-rhamnose isomerase/sugar isomerase|nr:L-rhamnose isomerase [Candidatus Binatia bacterium]
MSDAVFAALAGQLEARGLDVERALAACAEFEVETPSWGYGDSGTRFRTFPFPGAARTVWEKLEDAAEVHRLTGACPGVALHIPWDRVEDPAELVRFARARGLRPGSINPNLFQEEEYRLGSLTHPDQAVRRQALGHVRECVELARAVGSESVSLWLADGTNYAGQDDVRRRKARLEEGLREIYAALPGELRLLIEYKFFEPGFYHTDLADWGMAATLAGRLGERALVLVDTGHHAAGTNVEHVVAFLLDERRLGGFHFNARRYADDDLIAGSTNPFELFCIFHELRAAREDPELAPTARAVSTMIDQSHNIEPKVEAMVQSVVNLEVAHAKAQLVERAELRERQEAGDVLGAHRVLLRAFETDVRPLLAESRRRRGLDPDPIAALARSGYAARVAEERGKAEAGAGYPG